MIFLDNSRARAGGILGRFGGRYTDFGHMEFGRPN